MSDGTQLSAKRELEQSKYYIRHVNFGNDDGTPSSKFEIDFNCPDYTIARAILDLVVTRSGYKASKLVLSSKSPQHLPHLSELSYEDALPNLERDTRHPSSKEGGRVLIGQFEKQAVITWRGRIRGEYGMSTGRGFLTVIPTSIKRVFLFDRDKKPIGPANARKQELILEVLVAEDLKWVSGDYLDFHAPKPKAMLAGILKMLQQYEVNCPKCQQGCYQEKLVREMEETIYCNDCKIRFFVTLFE